MESVKSKIAQGMVNGKPHEVIVTEFLDKYFIIVSDCGKIGTLVQISFETDALKTCTLLASNVLFGKDVPEIHAIAQSIVDDLKIKKTVIFGFSCKEFGSTTAVDMRQLIGNALPKTKTENISIDNES